MSDVTVQVAAEDDDGIVVAIAGPMTVAYVTDIRDRLLEFLARMKSITVDISGITAIDVAGLQLFCSAHRAATRAQQPFFLDWKQGGVVLETALMAGLMRECGCRLDVSKTCVWMGGKC